MDYLLLDNTAYKISSFFDPRNYQNIINIKTYLGLLEVPITLCFASLVTSCYGTEIFPYQDGSGILHYLLGENILIFSILLKECGKGGYNPVKRSTPNTNSSCCF